MIKKEWIRMSDLKPNKTKTMDLKIRENGESNIKRIICYNSKGISVVYKDEPLRRVIKALHEVITID